MTVEAPQPIPFAAAVLARSTRRTQSGRRTTAMACAQAWVLAVHAGDHELADQARRELNTVCRSQRDLAATRQAYSVADAGLTDAPNEKGQAHHDLAVLISDAWQRGELVDPDGAVAAFEQAAVMFMLGGDSAALARLETDRAMLEFALGRIDDAVAYLEQAQQCWRARHDTVQLAETLLTLADCLDAAEQPSAAIRRYREAEILFCEIGDGTSANAAAVRAELISRRTDAPGTVIDLRDAR